MQICKEKNFLVGGEGTPLPESQNFWDIIGKNLVIFHKFSRFISKKINPCYQNMFQLMCEKKNFIGFTLHQFTADLPLVQRKCSHYLSMSVN